MSETVRRVEGLLKRLERASDRVYDECGPDATEAFDEAAAEIRRLRSERDELRSLFIALTGDDDPRTWKRLALPTDSQPEPSEAPNA